MPSVRDPVHGFVSYDHREQAVINSQAFQRLRFIGQLATTPWLYPGAKHSRFEHSIGVMHLASRIFDKVWPKLVQLVPRWSSNREEMRKRLRLAALLHDVGHPAFSHAFEELLEGGSHEKFTGLYVLTDPELQTAFSSAFAISSREIATIALDPKKKAKFFPDLVEEETAEVQFLNQILTGDLLGADRMDYLLRDSLHAGVMYGHFDLERVLDTITVIKDEAGPRIAIERGGLEAAEGLLLARYYMSNQVYYHHVRRILDEWIRRSIMKVFGEKNLFGDPHPFATLEDHRRLTDDRVQVKIREAWEAGDCDEGGVFFERSHPRLAYEVPQEVLKDFKLSVKFEALRRFLHEHLTTAVGADGFWVDGIDKESISAAARDVAVVTDIGSDRSHRSFGGASRVVSRLPRIQAIYVFSIDPENRSSIERACREWESSASDLLTSTITQGPTNE